MQFSNQLNEYIERLGCTAKELAEASGLSASVISRYRTGEREPSSDSDQFSELVYGIVQIAASKNIAGINENQVADVLKNALSISANEYENFATNYDTLITTLDVNMKALSAFTNFDTSYLYRVRSGQRKPGDLDAFCDSFCQFILENHSTPSDKAKAAALFGCDADALCDGDQYLAHLHQWLYQEAGEDPSAYMEDFLKKLDEFDLDEYIRAIHFDELKVPTMPFQLHTSKNYYGIREMRKGELDFFKTTVLSKSREPIFMCGDMPMEDMAEDMDFNKKWMFAIAMSLKKGLHLNIIHNIDRPFQEMMLGLESWIPIYMTGQVSPYHLPNISTDVYHHLNYVSGVAALSGECINGFHSEAKYYLTTNRTEIAYYQKKAAALLSKAQPLMEIFRAENASLFQAFLVSDAEETGGRHNILSAPPIHTITPELLQSILKRSQLPEADRDRILRYAAKQRELTESILQHNSILEEITILSSEEFSRHPVSLPLADLFYETTVPYTYEEYLSHIQLTEEYALCHPLYRIKTSAEQAFRNIRVHIVEKKYVMISKSKAPEIHFVIRHPKMVSALEKFVAPVME